MAIVVLLPSSKAASTAGGRHLRIKTILGVGWATDAHTESAKECTVPGQTCITLDTPAYTKEKKTLTGPLDGLELDGLGPSRWRES